VPRSAVRVRGPVEAKSGTHESVTKWNKTSKNLRE
jgi:hypothetical protein